MPAKKSRTKKKAAPKKAAPKKKVAVKKKAAPKKAVAKKKAVPKEKKPSKKELAEEKALLEREEKKKKRIELLNKRANVDLPVEGITPYTMHRGESYMSDSQLEHFRNILLTWKQELLDEVSRCLLYTSDAADE